jgi:hypothetical protein
MRSSATLFALLVLAGTDLSLAFRPVAIGTSSTLIGRPLFAKKGFGKTPEPAPTKVEPKTAVEPAARSTPEAAASSTSEEKNGGQRALNDMRRQRAESKDTELRKVRELMDADSQLQEAPAVIPEKVAQRMGKRMLPFVGIPLFVGMGGFVAFWYYATYKNVEVQPNLVAASTILILVFGLGVCSRETFIV